MDFFTVARRGYQGGSQGYRMVIQNLLRPPFKIGYNKLIKRFTVLLGYWVTGSPRRDAETIILNQEKSLQLIVSESLTYLYS